MNTTNSRRFFLKFVPGAIVALWATRGAAASPQVQGGQQNPPERPPRPAPGPGTNPSQSPIGPAGSNSKDNPKGDVHNVEPTDPKQTLKANQSNLHRDVNQLLQLAQDLKKEVDKTDSTEVLSISMLRKAEEIQKLARHIASLARS